jgi:diaminopimelate epimerase
VMDFTKMHGAANDFVVVDGRSIERDWQKLAIAVCDRHRGIGADSLVILVNSDKAEFGMRTFDTDGFESETCGNGIRCLAKYIIDKGLVSHDIEKITIETVATINKIRVERKGGEIVKFWANMGKPRFKAEQIPVNFKAGRGEVIDIKSMLAYRVVVEGSELTLNLVSMGNPHAVHFINKPVADFPLSQMGPAVENMSIFPKRVNFEVARILDQNNIEARVWERGVGETLACGSGACAIAVASKIRGYTEYRVDIKMPGGVLNVELNGDSEVILGGPATLVFEGKWPD